jgi:mRNA interferase RelE/StbE
MPYHIEYDAGVLKSLRRVPHNIQDRILKRIGALADNPRGPGCVKLTGEEAYRVRVGDYRIIYTVEDDRLLVLVVDIGHRGDVYRRR